MRLVTFQTKDTMSAGVVHEQHVVPLDYPTLLELLQDPQGMSRARQAFASGIQGFSLAEIRLLTPVPIRQRCATFMPLNNMSRQLVKSADWE
jgi:fumarylacetoacetate (FAA) hydrolase